MKATIERGTGAFMEYFEKQLGIEAEMEGDIVGSLLFSSAAFDRKKIAKIITEYFSGISGIDCEIIEDEGFGNKEREISFSIRRTGEKDVSVVVVCAGGSMLVMCS